MTNRRIDETQAEAPMPAGMQDVIDEAKLYGRELLADGRFIRRNFSRYGPVIKPFKGGPEIVTEFRPGQLYAFKSVGDFLERHWFDTKVADRG